MTAAIERATANASGVVSDCSLRLGIRNGSPQDEHLGARESTKIPHIGHLVIASLMRVILPQPHDSEKAGQCGTLNGTKSDDDART